jgi:hypothetical protein
VDIIRKRRRELKEKREVNGKNMAHSRKDIQQKESMRYTN